MTQHKVVSLRLYRLLLRATKPIFRKPYAELLNETVTVFHPHISRLSQGDTFLNSYRTNPRKALRQVVQNGAASDTQVCVDMIPDLIRFLRAGKLVYEEDLFKTPRKCHPLGSMRSLYDLSPGGLLLTKIGTMEKVLAARKRKIPLDDQHSDLLSRSMEYMKRTFSRTLHARRRDGSASDLTSLGKHSLRAYYAFLALDRLFWLWDTNNIPEIDTLFPSFTYFPPDSNERLMGNMLFFQALINNMDYLNLEAYGSIINNELYLKILRKPSPSDPSPPESLVYQFDRKPQVSPPYLSNIFPNHPGAIPWKPTSHNMDNHKGSSSPSSSSSSSSSSTADVVGNEDTTSSSPLSQTVYTHRLSAKQLGGHHYFADRSYEITLKYHPETYTLEAVMYLDPNKSVFAQAPNSKPGDGRWRVPKDHVIWRIDLSQYHHEEQQGSIPGVSAADEEERKHWLYLDREYQGVELPVSAEFYMSPPSPDGRFHKPPSPPPSETAETDAVTPAEETNNTIFGEDGIVPNVCYVKFARPPSQARIETCLLPHLHYQNQSSSSSSTTTTNNKSSSEQTTPSATTANEPAAPVNADATMAASSRPTDTRSFRQVDSTTTTRVTPLETPPPLSSSSEASPSSPSSPSSSSPTPTFTTIETVYHQLPSFLTVEARFCDFHEDDDVDDEGEVGEAVVDMGDVVIIGDPSSNGVGAVLTAEEVKTMMKNHEPTDEQVAFAVHFMDFLLDNMNVEAGFAFRPMDGKKNKHRSTLPKMEQPPLNGEAATASAATTAPNPQGSDGEVSSSSSSAQNTSDFKALHADILAENQKQQQPTTRFNYTTIRYGHVRDVEGSWIQVTHDGLRMVFPAELFPPEPLPGMTDTNPMPVVQPLTSAQLMTYLTGLIAREAHDVGMRYPNYKVLGSNLAIKESEEASSEGHESSAADSGKHPLEERLSRQMIGGVAWNRGRQLSWNAAYWNAMHFYFRRRQQAVEELFATRSKVKTPPATSSS